VSFIRTGLQEIGLKVRRQRTRMALRHEQRLLQKSEINLGREGTSQAANFSELRNEIVALKKLEQEQKEVALRIAQIEGGIKKIEVQREENAREQNEAFRGLEAEKKTILQRRNDARNAADLCQRELAAVEERIRTNETAERDLQKKLAELQAQAPPPHDLESKVAAIAAQRARLPEERAELVRARLGSADAARVAKQKLAAAEEELAAVDRNIERTRAEFEARDRALTENVHVQQDAIRESRAHHQVVEERKNPAYLNIGRHLAAQGIAPPNAPHLLEHVQHHRAAVDRHQEHTSELAHLSSKIDKQELRQFYFAVISVLALLAIILPLVFKSPAKREWLPQETDVILSLNTDQFQNNDFAKHWRKEQPDAWQKVWNGLLGSAVRIPVLNLAHDTVRITRAATTNDVGVVREFFLVEARSDVSHVVRAVDHDNAFQRRTISGLPVWERPDLAMARVGPTTLALGMAPEVDELVRVRLGLQSDLKITDQLLDRFQSLNRDSALRLISRDPQDLSRVFHPLFTPELLNGSQLLGLALTLQNPVKVRMLLKMKSPETAAALARRLHDAPQRILHLRDSDLLLYQKAPEITKQKATLELQMNVPEETARLLLRRIARTDNPPAAPAD
jgi:hypothetical protein